MKPFRVLLLAGMVSAGATALAAYAYAGQGGLKTLILQLPGGGVAQVADTGSIPPQIVTVPAPMAIPVALPMAIPAPAGALGGPLAQFDQIAALMNAQTAAMMNVMNAMMAPGLAGPDALVPARFAAMPPGASASYALISSNGAGHGGCMESVQITLGAPGQAPHVVSHHVGACGTVPFGRSPASVTHAPRAAAPQWVPAVRERPALNAAPDAPKLIRARADLPVTRPMAAAS